MSIRHVDDRHEEGQLSACLPTPRPPQHRLHVHQLTREPIAQSRERRVADEAVGGEGGAGGDDGLRLRFCCFRWAAATLCITKQHYR